MSTLNLCSTAEKRKIIYILYLYTNVGLDAPWGLNYMGVLPLLESCFTCTVLHVSNSVDEKRQFEPHHEKTCFLHMRKQSHRSAAQLISAFVFTM